MSEKLRTIIVEDEELARNLMKSFLKTNEKIEIINWPELFITTKPQRLKMEKIRSYQKFS